jgi:galactose oxidase
VQTPDAGNVVKATWIRLGSVTHAFNMNQRINHLAVTPATGGLNIVAPSDPNLTPPGHYMLFLLNDKGVPSIAKIIQIT